MKVYRGRRGPGGTVVTVDGRPLDPRTDLRDFHAAGFEWGYEGSGPSQLALAILADLHGDGVALRDHRAFMQAVICDLEGDDWTLSAEQIAERAEQVAVVPMDLETLLRKVRGEI